MATPSTLPGTSLTIRIGDGESPETFAHPCLINAERGVTFATSTNDILVPDCSNPEDPAWRELQKDGITCSISGAGIMDNVLETIQLYSAWVRSDDAKNVRVYLGNVGYWEGPFQLTNWELTGERGGKVQSTIALESDGAVGSFTAAA